MQQWMDVFCCERCSSSSWNTRAMKVAPPDFKIYGNQVHGEVITFKSNDAQKAYQAIEDLEPSNVYRWSVKKLTQLT